MSEQAHPGADRAGEIKRTLEQVALSSEFAAMWFHKPTSAAAEMEANLAEGNRYVSQRNAHMKRIHDLVAALAADRERMRAVVEAAVACIGSTFIEGEPLPGWPRGWMPLVVAVNAYQAARTPAPPAAASEEGG